MQSKEILKAQVFLKKSFQKNPSFSFGDWKVMYNHSIMVKDFAVKIAQELDTDQTVAAISALLHDVGKTYKASHKYLENHHKDLNYKVSKNLLKSLLLTKVQHNKIKSLLNYTNRTVEMNILKDADALAFFKDTKLQSAFFSWALKLKRYDNIKRHLKKYDNLIFPLSKRIGKPWFTKMIKTWQPKLNKFINE